MRTCAAHAFLALLVLISTASCARVTSPNKVPKNAVLLSKVASLTLRAGKNTSSRRVSPVPQLNCIGVEDVCKLYEVDVMRCTNEGADYDAENIQWACKANLPEEFKLGSTDVYCEGYESSDDPYVLKGSCGVEYRLLLTDKGEAKYRSQKDTYQSKNWWGKAQQPLQGDDNRMHSRPEASPKGERIAGFIFFLIFGAVLVIILTALIRACIRDRNNPRRPRAPRTSGNNGGGDDDPPPPYDYQPPPKRKTTPRSYGSNPSSTSTRSKSSAGSQAQEGWRPGVWTGAAAGAAAGYMAGRNSRSTQANPPPSQPPMRQSTGRGWLFGNGGGGSNSDTNTNAGSGGGGPSSTPSYSATRHESTGFGGTRRR